MKKREREKGEKNASFPGFSTNEGFLLCLFIVLSFVVDIGN
jgi:hypothetical protein